MSNVYTAVAVSCTCPFCGTETVTFVPSHGFYAWQDGELIQNALPGLTPEQRETLISGMCVECQHDFFDEDEYGEDDYDE